MMPCGAQTQSKRVADGDDILAYFQILGSADRDRFQFVWGGVDLQHSKIRIGYDADEPGVPLGTIG